MNKNKKILALSFSITIVFCTVFTILYITSRNTNTTLLKPTFITSSNPDKTRQPDAVVESNSQQTPTTSNTPNQTYCGVENMPEGTCRVIESIEANGLKNNSLVAFDTSQLPDSSRIIMDRSSWKKSSDALSQIKITIEASGRKISGLLYIQLVDGSWKATGYTVS